MSANHTKISEIDKSTVDGDKNQYCLNMRTTSLCFGVFMAIISSFLLLASISAFIYLYFITSMGWNLDASYRAENSTDFSLLEVEQIILVNGLQIFILILSLLELSFDIVLIIGASRRKLGPLKAYFIFGNIKSVIILVASISLYVILWDNMIPGAAVLICCGINSMFNTAVYIAYGIIKRSTDNNSKFKIYNISENTEELRKQHIEWALPARQWHGSDPAPATAPDRDSVF